MEKIIFPILLLLVFGNCKAQKTAVKPVKSKTEWYTFRNYVDLSDDPIKKKVSLFDKNGELIKDTYFNLDGSVERMYSEEKMYYDNWSDTITLSPSTEIDMGYYVAGYWQEDTLRPKDLTKYDNRGNRILWVWENKVFTYTYDDNNNVIESTTLKVNGRVQKELMQYNETNLMIKKTKTDSRNDNIQYHQFEYDENAHLIKIIKTDQSYKIFEVRALTYEFYQK